MLCTHVAAADLVRRTFTVDGIEREALVSMPARDDVPPAGAPLVFVFHGHGGTSRNASRQFSTHTLWPDAIVVYPQGLKTPGAITDPEGAKTGWQRVPRDQRDRDIAFFDVMLASICEGATVDRRRVYATGHSNGGGFTYLLWRTRHEVFAAVAPSSAYARSAADLQPLPAMHIAGEQDTLVEYDRQVAMMKAVRAVNGCDADGTPWAADETRRGNATVFASSTGTPFVRYVHSGGHGFPHEAAPLIVRFFKQHVKEHADSRSIIERIASFYGADLLRASRGR
ncbi:MAG: esterase [Phycisphaerae bacterium]|nr:esterase [Phycisphaerae bacterium]